MSAQQLALLPPWWSETTSERGPGDRRFVRYRCARCLLWGELLDGRKAPPGACRRCVELPFRPPPPDQLERDRYAGWRSAVGVVDDARREAHRALLDVLRARRERLQAEDLARRASALGNLAELVERATARTAAGGDPSGRISGCRHVQLGDDVSAIVCTRGRARRVHLASPTGTVCGRRPGTVPMLQQTRDLALVTCRKCLPKPHHG